MKRAAALIAAVLGFAGAARAESPQLELRLQDAQGAALEPLGATASFSRTLPPELGGGADPDALRFLLLVPAGETLGPLQVTTTTRSGQPLDVLVDFPTQALACPAGAPGGVSCRRTAPLRLVADAGERHLRVTEQRSLRGELGGVLRVVAAGRTLLELPVSGWRRQNELFRARVRAIVLRPQRGGAPALGGDVAGARRVVEAELASAARIWAQCGVTFSAPVVEVAEPPRGQLLTLGCDLGQPATGGTLRLASKRRSVSVQTRPGESPSLVAQRLAQLLTPGGQAPPVFENQRAAAEPLPSADVVLPALDHYTVTSTDPTMTACLGQLELSDGLSHFGDGDAFSGTFEERALLRAFDDGDPASIELLFVPDFEHGERIGESFIVSPGSSLSSSVILDRSAIEAGARSFALAHELGHVLMSMPGHPDDFGVDMPWSLMDADVADASVFGPRRLSLSDCARVVMQAGPQALVPLLEASPLKAVR